MAEITNQAKTPGDPIQEHERIRVHWNKHRKVYSVLRKYKEGWRVRSHATTLTLDNPKHIFSFGGWQRALEERRRNVHSLIEGELSHVAGNPNERVAVRYMLELGEYVLCNMDEIVYVEDYSKVLLMRPDAPARQLLAPRVFLYP